MCVPIKNETISNRKLFMAIRVESNARDALESLRVSIKNIGLFPSGFTMGNKAPRIKIVLSRISFTRSSGASFRTAARLEYSASFVGRELRDGIGSRSEKVHYNAC